MIAYFQFIDTVLVMAEFQFLQELIHVRWDLIVDTTLQLQFVGLLPMNIHTTLQILLAERIQVEPRTTQQKELCAMVRLLRLPLNQLNIKVGEYQT